MALVKRQAFAIRAVERLEAQRPSARPDPGDIEDRDSVVRAWKSEPTNYGLLADLNTMPRTTYLAAVRNPNPDMPKPRGA